MIKTALHIDSHSLYISALRIGKKVDYSKEAFVQAMSGDDPEETQAHVYIGVLDPNDHNSTVSDTTYEEHLKKAAAQNKFLSFLFHNGYKVHKIPFKGPNTDPRPDMAARIVEDILNEEIEEILICSSDSYFIPYMELAKREGKHVGLVVTTETCSEELTDAASEVVNLETWEGWYKQ